MAAAQDSMQGTATVRGMPNMAAQSVCSVPLSDVIGTAMPNATDSCSCQRTLLEDYHYRSPVFTVDLFRPQSDRRLPHSHYCFSVSATSTSVWTDLDLLIYASYVPRRTSLGLRVPSRVRGSRIDRPLLAW